MKKLITLIGIFFTLSAHAVGVDLKTYSAPNPDTVLINKADPSEYIKPIQTARSINPLWGVGSGFHTLRLPSGRTIMRSNPDGLLWNNKYYKW